MSGFEVGHMAKVEDMEGTFEILKVHKSSCKLLSSVTGKITIKPFAFITKIGGGGKKASTPPSRKRTEEEKPASRKRPSGSYTKPHDEEDDDSVADTVDTKAHKKKSRKGGVDDGISALLTKCSTPNQMIDAVKKHKAYKFINADSFKNTVAQRNDLQLGLFRMRMGNLLRGAINRSQKPVKEKK